MKNAAIGFRVHSGWAAAVAVCLENGVPRVVAHERVHLVPTFTYEFRQPYHTAEKMPFDKARDFVGRVEKEASTLAHRAIRELQSELEKQGIKVTTCSLLTASAKSLPALEKILASHALIHTADGELFRAAIFDGSARCALRRESIREKQLLECAKKALRRTPAALLKRVTELGKPFGSPWSQDEKFATLAAWLALHSPNAGAPGGNGKKKGMNR